MTFFNRTYHAFIKSHMSRIGVWPEQSKSMRIMLHLVIVCMALTFVTPQLARLHDVWGDGEIVIAIMPTLLTALIIFTAAMNCVLQTDKIKVMLEEMEGQWKLFKNTSAVIVLDKYAGRACYLTKLYAIYINIALALYFVVLMSPVILDFVYPLNETRQKFYFYEAEYGVDPDKYYWIILAHGYTVAVLGVNMTVTTVTIYVLLVEHACALFEVVGFNLKLATGEHMANKRNTTTIRYENNNQQICDCIVVHKKAISFANRLENFYSLSLILVMGITAILISVTGVQIVINIESPDMLLRTANFTFGQIFHLCLNSIPGQQLIDSSLRLHTYVSNLNWYDMSVKVQKLLIPILIRSNKPCILTAGKVYVLSIQSFGSAMRTALSYFMVFARLV